MKKYIILILALISLNICNMDIAKANTPLPEQGNLLISMMRYALNNPIDNGWTATLAAAIGASIMTYGIGSVIQYPLSFINIKTQQHQSPFVNGCKKIYRNTRDILTKILIGVAGIGAVYWYAKGTEAFANVPNELMKFYKSFYPQ